MALGTVRLSEILKFKLSVWIPCYYANYRCVNFIFWTSLFVYRKSYVNLLFLWENCHQHQNFSATTSPVVTVFTFHVMFYFPGWNRKNVFFQDILGSRTLSDRVLVLLSNMETYLRFASREPTSAWESQLSHFEAFFRKLPSVLPENVSLSRNIY